jgi:hypothetical protein
MLPESTPFSELLRDAKWKPIRDTLTKFIPQGSCPTIQQLGSSATLHDIFEHDDASGELWKVREASETLKAHFPEQENTPACGIVPLTSMITLLAVKSKKVSFRCTIGEPLLADDIFRITPQGIQLIKKDGTIGVTIVETHELQQGDYTLGKNIQIP